MADACFINQGNGQSLEQSIQRGMTGTNDRSLGVVIADFTGDGRPDVYVANDTTENFLYVNLGEARFEDRATLLGCAVDREGGLQASMGVAAGDYDYKRLAGPLRNQLLRGIQHTLCQLWTTRLSRRDSHRATASTNAGLSWLWHDHGGL